MAQSGYTPIQLYYSSIPTSTPSISNLAYGELAINITDGKLYYRDGGNVLQVIAAKGTGTIGGTNTQVQFNDFGALGGSSGFVYNKTTTTLTVSTLNLTNALGVSYGGTGQTTFTDGQLLIGNSTGNTLTKATLTAGSGITITNGAGSITIAASSAGVSSVSFGSTGLTPSTATSGAVTVAGTLAVANGGTGLNSYTANSVLYASGTGTLASAPGLTYASGSVGIGVTSPFYKLDVEQFAGSAYIASLTNTSTSTTQASLIRITQNASGAATGFIGTFGSTYSGSVWANTFGVSTLGSNPLSLGTNNTVRVQIDTTGNAQMFYGAVMPYAPAPASISTTATLANADIQAQIINTTGTSYTVTMPTGSTLDTLAPWAATNVSYDFTVINTASGTITMAGNTGVTTLGGLTIATGTSAQFRIRRTAASTYVLYRLS